MTDCALRTEAEDVEYREAFPPTPGSARRARTFARSSLGSNGIPSDVAELILSELIANVAEHAHTRVTVRIILGEAVRLEVHDGNAIIPAMVDAALDAERGRGLMIVDALATDWGIEPTATGKRIWVEIPRDDC